jgi:predicted nucleotidyltransferase
MYQIIRQKLVEIEQQKNIRILYACESGSRAYGFASPDSDYDVRFIYVRNKLSYLSINEPDSIIELAISDMLDIGGWELRKSLRMFRKSNVTLYEWLQSPVVYRQDETFMHELKPLMPDYFSLRAGTLHYIGFTRGAWKDMQDGEVKVKKYFYCLRTVLAALWIIEKHEIPPMEFSKLRTLITDKDCQDTVDELIRLKSVTNEKTLSQPVTLLYDFIEAQIKYCEEHLPDPDRENMDYKKLNILFRKQLYDF